MCKMPSFQEETNYLLSHYCPEPETAWGPESGRPPRGCHKQALSPCIPGLAEGSHLEVAQKDPPVGNIPSRGSGMSLSRSAPHYLIKVPSGKNVALLHLTKRVLENAY